MVEKAERTVKFEENAKLIRELQLELLKRYALLQHRYAIQPVLCSTPRSETEIESSNTGLHRADAWLDA
jgi:hypothetical protein